MLWYFFGDFTFKFELILKSLKMCFLLYLCFSFLDNYLKRVVTKKKTQSQSLSSLLHFTVQKIKFPIKNFFSNCNEIRRKQRNRSHLLKKSLIEHVIFLCSVSFKNYLKFGSELTKVILLKRRDFWSSEKTSYIRYILLTALICFQLQSTPKKSSNWLVLIILSYHNHEFLCY